MGLEDIVVVPVKVSEAAVKALLVVLGGGE